ncbi:MAG TPA: hypothetical protein VGQ09_10245 [Chitinophagaceae bacterium]|jgi:hypothetical protein|nr:hypothetical protein [Chitinophagaceae bacterium]
MKLPKAILTTFLLFSFAKAYTQTADEIIEKHIKAIGGKDAWKKVNTIKQQAIIDFNGTEVNVEAITAHEKGSRQTISFAGLSGYTIYTPTAGYNFYPWQGHVKPEAITPEDLKENEDNMDAQGPLIDYKEKGHVAEYIGMDDFEGTDCYKIKLTEKSGKIITFYIDPSNYFIIHSVTITKANGQETESKTDYSNYQKFSEGIWMPMNIGGGNTIKIKKVEINIPVDESVFKPSTN